MTTLYPFQESGVSYALDHKYIINASTMGTGKTLMALEQIDRLGFPALIICPAFLKNVWAAEAKKHKPHLKITICKTKADIPKTLSGIVVVNYEQAEHFGHLVPAAGTVVIDEAHALKNIKAKRTVLIHKMIKANPPKYLTLLTGTPIKNRVPELYSLLLLCSYCPTAMANGYPVTANIRSHWNFCKMFCEERAKRIPGGAFVTEFYGLKNPEKLKALIEGKYFRIKTENVLKLPEEIHQNIPVAKITHAQDLEDAYARFEKGKVANTETPVKLAVAVEKIKYTAQYIETILEEDAGPVVVFSDHVSPCEQLQEYFTAKSFKSAVITGKVDANKRQGIVDRFQAGDLDALFCTIGAASVGITLTRSNRIVFNDLPWVPGDLDQAKKRIHRIGQNRTVFYSFITAPGIDENIVNTLVEKSRVISNVFDNTEESK